MTMQITDIHRVMKTGQQFIEVYDKPTEQEEVWFWVGLICGIGILLCVIIPVGLSITRTVLK